MSVKKSLSTHSGCLVCFNSLDNVLIPVEESQNIFNICCSYVKTAINIKYLIKHVNENNNNMTFCKTCMEYVLTLTQVAEQFEDLKTQITDLTNRFSESIFKRRRQPVKNTENKTQCSKNTNRNVTDVSSEDEQLFLPNTSLNKIEYVENSNVKNMIEGLSINLLPVKVEHLENETEDFGSEIVNRESNNLFSEEEYLSPSLFCEVDESNVIANDPLIFNEDDNDNHVRGNDFESTCGFAMDDDIKSEKQIITWKSESPIQVNNPIILREGIRKNANFSKKYISSTHPREDKPLRCNSNETKSHNSSNRQFPNNQSVKGVKSNYSNVCKCCKKRFSTSAILTRHMKIHTGKRPFKCSVCKRGFLESGTLKRHFMTHTGERPHKCSQCERSFIQGSDLKIHERIHSGVIPFKCMHCEKAYRTEGARSKHQLKVHGIMELK